MQIDPNTLAYPSCYVCTLSLAAESVPISHFTASEHPKKRDHRMMPRKNPLHSHVQLIACMVSFQPIWRRAIKHLHSYGRRLSTFWIPAGAPLASGAERSCAELELDATERVLARVASA